MLFQCHLPVCVMRGSSDMTFKCMQMFKDQFILKWKSINFTKYETSLKVCIYYFMFGTFSDALTKNNNLMFYGSL